MAECNINKFIKPDTLRNLSFRQYYNAAAAFVVCLLLNSCVWYDSYNLAPPVTGRVIDKTSGKHIAGACVTYKTNYAPYTKTAITGKDGLFKLDGITSRYFYLFLPFRIQIPFSSYTVSETESPACYIQVVKPGYVSFSTLLKAKNIDKKRQLAHFDHSIKDKKSDNATIQTPNDNKKFLGDNNQEILQNFYSNITLSKENHLLIYLQNPMVNN